MLQNLWQLILQTRCPLCQRPAHADFCLDCWRQLQQCHTQSPPKSEAADSPAELSVFAWGAYGGALKRAIAALKYHNQPSIAKPLGQALAQAWLQSPHRQQRASVIPIPLHHERQSQRGYNQAALLAQHFCRVTGLPFYANGLTRQRKTEAQFGLSVAQRQQNLAHAFTLGTEAQQLPHHLPILLLDDIYTTGTTAAAARLILRQAGFKVWGILALARAYRIVEKTEEADLQLE